jgi:hypothetical protein
MRQRDAAMFAERLNRLREGEHTQEDIEAFKKRLLTAADDRSAYSILQRHMFNTHKKFNVHNAKALEELPTETIRIVAQNHLTAANVPVSLSRHLLERASNLDFWKTQGLLYCLDVKLGMIVDMTCNPNIPDGLCNGAWGTIQAIDFGMENKERTVNVLWMKFDDARVGKRRRSAHESVYQGRPGLDRLWTPIHRLFESFTIDKQTHLTEIQRSQFPLRPATASTFQHCQGMTPREGAIDCSGPHLFGRHYVGLSRFTKEDDFFILDLAEDRIRVSPAVKQEMHCLRSSALVNILPQALSNSYQEYLTSITFNARSLHSYLDDIHADYRFRECDVLLVGKTRANELDNNDFYYIPGFRLLRSDAPRSTTQKQGCALYLLDNLPAHTLHTYSTDGLQIIIAQIENLANQIIVIVGLYRSPSFPLHTFFTKLAGIISRFQPSNMILMGDFNVDLLAENVPQEFTTFFRTYGFSQHVPFHTSDYGSLLDHFWTNFLPHAHHGCFETSFSDHSPVWFCIKLQQ